MNAANALAIPIPGHDAQSQSPLHRIEHGLHPWVAFGILPLFAFAKAGVSLAGVSLSDFLAPLPLGIAAGLVLGKQLGVFGATFLWRSKPVSPNDLPAPTGPIYMA